MMAGLQNHRSDIFVDEEVIQKSICGINIISIGLKYSICENGS